MSIASSICADYSNEVKNTWVKRLEKAIESNDMKEVEKIKEEIKQYYFTE